MTVSNAVAIIRMYEKHDWHLRRLRLKAETKSMLMLEMGQELQGVQICESETDCAWFSRGQEGSSRVWELRFLGVTPFALIETLDESDIDFESGLQEVEQRLAYLMASKIRLDN